MPRWVVYLVRCADGSLYAGATNDLQARLTKHNAGTGARYTRSRRPVTLAWSRRVGLPRCPLSQGDALSLEAFVKRLSRADKVALAAGRRAVLTPWLRRQRR